MDQNQTLDNQVLDQATDNDLQKAIDNITNTTNVDPVFSDPVAAPSSIPEGDTGELSEPVGPFPAPEPQIEVPAPEPAPLAADAPSLDTPTIPAPESLPLPEPAPAVVPEPAPIAAPAPEPAPLASLVPEPLTPDPAVEPVAPEPAAPAPTPENLNMHQVKEAALRDLMPLVDHLNMTPSQKFSFYRNIFEQLKDYTVLDRAYHAATEISDEKERAEALLYLVESIDKM